MKLLLFTFSCLIVAICTATFPRTWDDFAESDNNSFKSLFDRYKQSFSKEFKNFDDETIHFKVFQGRATDIFDWNKDDHPYIKGITAFTDLTDDERHNYVMPENKINAVWMLVVKWSNFDSTVFTYSHAFIRRLPQHVALLQVIPSQSCLLELEIVKLAIFVHLWLQ